jgi:hypothetical protein
MQEVLIGTRSHDSYLITPANITVASTIVAPVPVLDSTGTGPANSVNGGVLAMGKGGMETCSAVKVEFFGVGSTTNTFIANAYGWELVNSIQTGVNGLKHFVPVLLATFTGITLDSAFPGVNGTDVPATSYYCSSITLGTGNSGISVEVVSPGTGVGIAHAVIDVKGCKFFELRFAVVDATSANAIVKRM